MANVEPTRASIEATRLKAARIKRETRNLDIIEICDALLGGSMLESARQLAADVASHEREGCPVCAARRKAKAATQARWRRNARARA